MEFSFLTCKSGLLILFLFSVVFGQTPVDEAKKHPDKGTEFVYFLFDLSTKQHADELTSVFENMSSVKSFHIDLDKHAVLVVPHERIEKGTQAWFDFNSPIRRALKNRGYVYLKSKDLDKYYNRQVRSK